MDASNAFNSLRLSSHCDYIVANTAGGQQIEWCTVFPPHVEPAGNGQNTFSPYPSPIYTGFAVLRPHLTLANVLVDAAETRLVAMYSSSAIDACMPPLVRCAKHVYVISRPTIIGFDRIRSSFRENTITVWWWPKPQGSIHNVHWVSLYALHCRPCSITHIGSLHDYLSLGAVRSCRSCAYVNSLCMCMCVCIYACVRMCVHVCSTLRIPKHGSDNFTLLRVHLSVLYFICFPSVLLAQRGYHCHLDNIH